jgi:ABC-2 type transport system permease protein
VRHVDLGSAQWVQAAAAILLGLAPVAALGIAIGYFARPQTLQPLFSMVRRYWHCWGGLWVPAEAFPHVVQDVM